MKLQNKLFIVILFAGLLCSCGTAQECTAKVSIKSDFPAITVYINNEFAGHGDTEKELTDGIYIISVIEESDRYNSKSFLDTLIIKDCKDTLLYYNIRAEVYFDSKPQDAYVFVKDTLVGHTPLFLSDEIKTVILKKKGYEDKIIIINEASLPVQLRSMGDSNNDSFFENNLFKILTGSIIALGATSAYFKIMADNRFDEYQVTGDQNLLDLTHDYDLVSGISFTALQINFGLLVYFFLVD